MGGGARVWWLPSLGVCLVLLTPALGDGSQELLDALLAPDTRAPTSAAASVRAWGGTGAEPEKGNATACLAKLAAVCPLKLVEHPSMQQREHEAAECRACTNRSTVAIQLRQAGCLSHLETAYCDLPQTGDNKVSEACDVALTAAFQPLANDPTGARGSEAIASWGQHLGDPGWYYQCEGTPGFTYWQIYFSPKKSGGPKRQLQPGGHGHHHHDGDDSYDMKKLGLCFPEQCSAQDAGKLGDKIVPLIAPVADLLTPLQAVYARHDVPNPLDAPAIAVVAVLVTFAILCAIATARSSSIWSECAAAMPLDENVLGRFEQLLAAAHADDTPDLRQRANKLSIGQKWDLVSQWEALGCKTPATLPKYLTAPAATSVDLDASTLATPLLPIAAPGGSLNGAELSSQSGRTRLGPFWNELLPFVQCWCAKESFHILVKKDTREVPEMRCLNGIRALSMMWIVLGHTFQSFQGAMGFGPTDSNELYAALNVRPRLSAQLVTGGQLGVDTFFFLSGFLAAYIGLKKLPSNSNPFKVFGGYMWERWIRLTPAYLFILMFYIHLLPFLSVGPDSSSSMEYVAQNQRHPHDGVRRLQPGGGGYDDPCSDYLWTNIFYVSNLYPFSGDNGQFGQWANGNLGCMDWSWYLSVDFQLHLSMPWLLLLFKRSPRAAYGVMFAMWLAGEAYVYSLIYRWDGGICGYFFSTARGNEMTLYYDKPWCRCGPFFVGIALAFLFTQRKTSSGHLPPMSAFKLFTGYVSSNPQLSSNLTNVDLDTLRSLINLDSPTYTWPAQAYCCAVHRFYFSFARSWQYFRRTGRFRQMQFSRFAHGLRLMTPCTLFCVPRENMYLMFQGFRVVCGVGRTDECTVRSACVHAGSGVFVSCGWCIPSWLVKVGQSRVYLAPISGHRYARLSFLHS